uniref:Spermine synthase n=1 Tax=Petromyzon marinus TaxID=7757 RepID=A0AAJ7UHP0_PETMA|nr:spermine synthase [Petromyzon marinus]
MVRRFGRGASSTAVLSSGGRPAGTADGGATPAQAAPCAPWGPVERFWALSDGRVVEYDFEEETLTTRSAYQSVRVLRSPQYGSTLVLNGDVNLAESDAAYTQCIMGDGQETFTGRDVLILGGGDGAILHSLLSNYKPRSITMLEIDPVVMEACRTHLRSVCGDVLDSLSGPTHQIVVGDCVPALRRYADSGTEFDFIINDLTAIPISTTHHHDSSWEFLWLILELSLKVLRPDGKYLTQGNGYNMRAALRVYEQHLGQLQPPVGFTRRTANVPSYLELWVFYTIWKKTP